MKPPEHLNNDSTQTAIDTETQKRLAGLETQSILPEEFSLEERGGDRPDSMDDASVSEPASAKKPVSKVLFTTAATGGVLGLVAVLAFGIFPRTIANKSQQPDTQDSQTAQIVRDDAAQLRSQLAFQDQKQLTRPNNTPSPSPEPASIEASAPPPAPIPAPAPSPPVMVSSSPSPVPAPVPVSSKPEPPVDPFERWAALANMGKQEADVELQPVPAATVAANFSTDKPIPSANSPFQTVELGAPPLVRVANQTPEARSESLPEFDAEAADNPETTLTPGTLGILRNAGLPPSNPLLPESEGIQSGDRPIDTPASLASAESTSTSSPIEVPLGTVAAASVMTPLVWNTSGNSSAQTGRFKIELSEDVKASNGAVALPKGTQLIVQATEVNPDNYLVAVSAIAILYRGQDGSLRQETLPPGAVLIQGHDGEPLVAEKLNDLSSEITQQDLLVGGLSALGRAGSLLNQPDEEFSQSIGSGSFSSRTIRRSQSPDLLPALVEGFFNTTAERIRQRSERNLQELIERNTIVVIPKDAEVSIVINSFFQVDP